MSGTTRKSVPETSGRCCPFFRIDYHLESTLRVCNFRYKCLLENLGLAPVVSQITRSGFKQSNAGSTRGRYRCDEQDAERQLEFYAELAAVIDVTLQQSNWFSPQTSIYCIKDALKTVTLLSRLYQKSPELKFLSEGVTIQIIDKLKTFQKLFRNTDWMLTKISMSSSSSSHSSLSCSMSSAYPLMEKCETCFTFFKPPHGSSSTESQTCVAEPVQSSDSFPLQYSAETDNPDIPPLCDFHESKSTTESGTLEMMAEDILYRCDTTCGTQDIKDDAIKQSTQLNDCEEQISFQTTQQSCVAAVQQDQQRKSPEPKQPKLLMSVFEKIREDTPAQSYRKSGVKGTNSISPKVSSQNFIHVSHQDATLAQDSKIDPNSSSLSFKSIEAPQWVKKTSRSVNRLQTENLYPWTPCNTPDETLPIKKTEYPLSRTPVQPFLPNPHRTDQAKPTDIEVHGRAGEVLKTLPKPRFFLGQHGSRCLSLESLQKIMQHRREHNEKFSIVTFGSRDPRCKNFNTKEENAD